MQRRPERHHDRRLIQDRDLADNREPYQLIKTCSLVYSTSTRLETILLVRDACRFCSSPGITAVTVGFILKKNHCDTPNPQTLVNATPSSHNSERPSLVAKCYMKIALNIIRTKAFVDSNSQLSQTPSPKTLANKTYANTTLIAIHTLCRLTQLCPASRAA